MVRDRYNANPQKGIKESWPGIIKNVKNVYYHADKYVGGLLPGGSPNFMGKLVKKAWKEQGDFWDEQDRKHLEFNKDVIDELYENKSFDVLLDAFSKLQKKLNLPISIIHRSRIHGSLDEVNYLAINALKNGIPFFDSSERASKAINKIIEWQKSK